MATKSSIRHGIFGGKIAFTAELGTGDSVTLIGTDIQAPREISALTEELFTSDDDGMNAQRELLVIYRVAAAAVATLGRDGRYHARDINEEVWRMERDLAPLYETIRSGEGQVLNTHGPRSDYV